MAQRRDIPKTQSAKTDNLWHAIIGTNGDGLITQFRDFVAEVRQFMKENRDWQISMSHRIVHIEETAWTREAHQQWEEDHDAERNQYRKDVAERWERRKMTTREWVMIGLTLVLAVATTAAVLR